MDHTMLLFKIFLFVFFLSYSLVKLPPCLLHRCDNRMWPLFFIAHMKLYTAIVHCTCAYLCLYTLMQRVFLHYLKNGLKTYTLFCTWSYLLRNCS